MIGVLAKDVIGGLREYEPDVLRVNAAVRMICDDFVNNFEPTGNNQADYEKLRDRAERIIEDIKTADVEVTHHLKDREGAEYVANAVFNVKLLQMVSTEMEKTLPDYRHNAMYDRMITQSIDIPGVRESVEINTNWEDSPDGCAQIGWRGRETILAQMKEENPDTPQVDPYHTKQNVYEEWIAQKVQESNQCKP